MVVVGNSMNELVEDYFFIKEELKKDIKIIGKEY
jgi:hypothetical protein